MNRKGSEAIFMLIALGIVWALVQTGAINALTQALNGTHEVDTTQTVGGNLPVKTVTDRTAIFDQLTVATPGTMDTYKRTAYGTPWADVDHNGCDTRNDVLNRDLTKREWKPNTHDCVVIVGILKDPYTGQTINFLKAKASKVQIDHVFPLGATWRMGADKWDDTKRKQIANDPLNLLAVDGPSNQKKSDSLPSEWLPPDKANRCGYVLRLAQVAVKYDLPVTQADKTTMVAQCPTGDATVTISPVTTAPAN